LFWHRPNLSPAALEIKPTARFQARVDNRQLQSKPARRDTLLTIVETGFWTASNLVEAGITSRNEWDCFDQMEGMIASPIGLSPHRKNWRSRLPTQHSPSPAMTLDNQSLKKSSPRATLASFWQLSFWQRPPVLFGKPPFRLDTCQLRRAPSQ
jgi:hypothetical protein